MLAPLALAAPGCDSETGIVIEVTKGDGFDQVPDTLKFLVGVEAEGLDLAAPIPCSTVDATQQRFIQAPESPSDVADVSDRDLHTDPYRLLLKPDQALPVDRQVLVAVGAFANDQLIGVGALEAPAEFIQGKVVRWNITLLPRGTISANLPCTCTSDYLGYDGGIITSPDDLDCDGAITVDDCDDNDPRARPGRVEQCGNGVDDDCNGIVDEPMDEVCDGADNNCDGRCDEGFDEDGDFFTTCGTDVRSCNGETSDALLDCNPTNPAVYPGAPELCDGLDNNCIANDERFPDFSYCYDYIEADGICRLGQRRCDDRGNGWVTECQPAPEVGSNVATDELCQAFAGCPADDGQFECANDRFNDLSCILHVVDDQTNPPHACDPAAQSLPTSQLPDQSGCTWAILGSNLSLPFAAGFIDSNSVPAGPFLAGCAGSLKIEIVDTPSADGEVLVWTQIYNEAPSYFRAKIKVEPVGSELECPEDTLVCDFSQLPLPAPAP